MIFRTLNLDRATAPARDRGRYAGSRASRSGVFHSAPRAPLAPPDVLVHFPVVPPIIAIKVLRCGATTWFKTLRISEESKFSDRDRARAGPRALRVIARMEAWFWGDAVDDVPGVPRLLRLCFQRLFGSSSIAMEVQGGKKSNRSPDCAE